MADQETIDKKMSALRTMLEIMGIPEFRQDTEKMHNIRWLSRNLRIDHGSHALFETANELVFWRLKLRNKADINHCFS